MNLETIEYFANIERRINKLSSQIEDLRNIVEETFHQEGGSQICPHRYECVQTKKHDKIEIRTYVCSLCGKTYKKVIDITKGE